MTNGGGPTHDATTKGTDAKQSSDDKAKQQEATAAAKGDASKR